MIKKDNAITPRDSYNGLNIGKQGDNLPCVFASRGAARQSRGFTDGLLFYFGAVIMVSREFLDGHAPCGARHD